MKEMVKDITELKSVLDGVVDFVNDVNDYNAGYIEAATQLELIGAGVEVTSNGLAEKRITNFKNQWTYIVGKNWIRIVHGDKVYAFVCIDKSPKKKWMKIGDILRPASNAQPSLNFNRGNVLVAASWKRYISKKGII